MLFFSLISSLCEVDSFIKKPPSVLSLEELTSNWFHWVAFLLFALAVIHTFLVNKITEFAKKLEKKGEEKGVKEDSFSSFLVKILYFMGEIEVVFGLWAIPLFFTITFFFSWKTALEYISTRDFTEAIFVVVIMSLASTKPIVELSERVLSMVAKLFGGRLSGWWFAILVVGPLWGSFITEAGAMTLSAVLLSKKFYQYKPSPSLAYATIALLFVNISIGGSLTNFAAPPLLIVSKCWGWNSWMVFQLFGVKAFLAIFFSSLVYFLFFRKQLFLLQKENSSLWKENHEKEENRSKTPFWIIAVHILFIIWVVRHAHYPAVFVSSYLLLLGFMQATSVHQYTNHLKKPLLVGFFLAALVIHTGVQGWWIVPVLQDLKGESVMILGTILTAFNDNAAIAYLTSLVPNWSLALKYSIMSGILAGGGLTIIANAPNPAGYVILRPYFKKGVSSVYLFLGAFFPTFIAFSLFFFWFL